MSVHAIKFRAPVSFPGQIIATNGVKATKANGIWTFELDYDNFAEIPISADPATVFALVYDPVAQIFYAAPLAALGPIANGTTRIITASGDVAVGAADGVIAFKQTVAAAANVYLPAATTRGGLVLSVEDLAGVAAANIKTIIPDGTETIDGLASIDLANDYGFIRLRPYAGIGWKVI